jgi:histidine triad (HIT) family protein
MPAEACLFCDIVSGKERSWVVYRDAQLMALLDPYPITRGHTLVIPIRHYESMFDIPDPLLRKIVSLSRRLCIAYEQTLKIQGVSIEVLNHRLKTPRHRHFHLHVIPRYDKDDKRDPANVKPSQTFPRESELNLNRTLAKVRAGLLRTN